MLKTKKEFELGVVTILEGALEQKITYEDLKDKIEDKEDFYDLMDFVAGHNLILGIKYKNQEVFRSVEVKKDEKIRLTHKGLTTLEDWKE